MHFMYLYFAKGTNKLWLCDDDIKEECANKAPINLFHESMKKESHSEFGNTQVKCEFVSECVLL